ncbi:kin of IRRE-like protein 3 [Centruroides vittatus]|uniref:kin of IRRE-like protein 3 n=2 Tax=Centruroides TaxID=6875 RepID=UPI00350EB2AA
MTTYSYGQRSLLLLVGLFVVPQGTGVSDTAADVTVSVLGVAGKRAALPCNISPPAPDDDVALVLWYKDDATNPLYSLDARRGNLAQARHSATGDIASRIHLITTPRPAVLQITDLSIVDEGEYRCRVDFRKARSRNSVIILNVIVLPKKPIIKDSKGELLENQIGPYKERDSLLLICEVEGGKPQPIVTWWRENVLTDDTYEATSNTVVRNELEIHALERKDLMTTFTCQATNSNLSTPVNSTVTIDMHLVPLEVSIEDKRRPLSADKAVDLVCRAKGSRPPAVISWWKGSVKLKTTREKVSSQDNVSTSILTFIPSVEDSGKFLSCRAENQAVSGSALEDGWKLDVHFIPQLTLRLGSKLRHSHIQEGNDVYFECNIRANPWVNEIGWKFENRDLHTNLSAGIIVSNQSLVLQKVQRANRGRYTCTATNSEGKGESNLLFLRIQFSPVCSANQKYVYGAARREAVKITCEVDADPSEVTFSWSFNNTSENVDLVTFTSEGSTSVATYTPRTIYDYGTVLCLGKNSVGLQREPCIYTIIPAGPPDSLQNCSVTNQTEESLLIECIAGYDGGLPQYFFMELYDSTLQRIRANMTTDTPFFVAHGLQPGTNFVVLMYAANGKGRSQAAVLRTNTLSPPESLTQKDDIWQVNISPIIIGVIAVIVCLVLVAVLIILVMKARRRNNIHKNHGDYGSDKCRTPLRQDTDDKREPQASIREREDKCPDIIPGIAVTERSSDIEKEVMGDVLWEATYLREAEINLAGPEFSTNKQVNQRFMSIEVPSPTAPMLPQRNVIQVAPMSDYTQSQQVKKVPPSGTPMRGEWTLPRSMHHPKNIQTDV